MNSAQVGDLLHRAQQCAVGVVDVARVAVAPGLGREREETDGAIRAILALSSQVMNRTPYSERAIVPFEGSGRAIGPLS